MKILKQALLFIASFALVFILCEIFISHAKITEVSFTEYYDDIGKGIAKPDTYVFFNEGFGITTTNSNRFIGKEISTKKNKNTIRIALIGDSFIEALQVFERDYFGNITEGILNQKLNNQNINVEVLNFGRSNFSIGNMYAYQRLYVDSFKPDYILYFLSKDDLECDYSFMSLLPVTKKENGNLKTVIDENTSDLNKYQKTKFISQNFTIGTILQSVIRKVKNKETMQTILGKFYTNPLNQNPIDKENYEIDAITHEIINSLDSNTIIINRENKELPDDFRKLVLSKNLKYLELSPVMDSLKNSGTEFNKWNVTNQLGHWNPKMHRALGIYMANEMNYIITNN